MRLISSARRAPSVTTRRVARGNRDGFTLIEVVVASVILSTALLAMAGFTVRYQQTESKVRSFTKAQQLAGVRLEAVRSAVPYASIDSMAVTESLIPGYPGFVRVTEVTRTGGTPSDTVDFRTVTVRVSTPGSTQMVSKSSTVAAF